MPVVNCQLWFQLFLAMPSSVPVIQCHLTRMSFQSIISKTFKLVKPSGRRQTVMLCPLAIKSSKLKCFLRLTADILIPNSLICLLFLSHFEWWHLTHPFGWQMMITEPSLLSVKKEKHWLNRSQNDQNIEMWLSRKWFNWWINKTYSRNLGHAL